MIYNGTERCTEATGTICGGINTSAYTEIVSAGSSFSQKCSVEMYQWNMLNKLKINEQSNIIALWNFREKLIMPRQNVP